MDTSLVTNIEKDPDHSLVTAAKRGETHAFEKLMLRHKRKVFAIALRITKNREDAEDVMQESFHKAFLHLGGFQQASQFCTWLTRITCNEAYMLLRRRKMFFDSRHFDRGVRQFGIFRAWCDGVAEEKQTAGVSLFAGMRGGQ